MFCKKGMLGRARCCLWHRVEFSVIQVCTYWQRRTEGIWVEGSLILECRAGLSYIPPLTSCEVVVALNCCIKPVKELN